MDRTCDVVFTVYSFSHPESTRGKPRILKLPGLFGRIQVFLGCRKWRPEAAKTLETANGKSRAISDERVSSASRVMLVKVVDWSLDSILQTTI